MASTPGFEPGPHRWEASALTTAPPLLPNLDNTSWQKKLKNESLIHSNYFTISVRPKSSNQLALTKAGENGGRMINGTKAKSRGI